MSDRTVRVRLVAQVDQYRAAMRNAKRDTDDLGKQVTATSSKSHQSLQTLGRGMVIGGAAVVAGFGAAIAASARFEKEMSGVKAVANASASEMKQLSDAALKAGADTAFSASDAARAEAELAKAGIGVKDILGGALTGALSLAAAGQMDLADAATVSAQAMNVFNLEGKDVGHIADVLASAANKSAADVKSLGDGLRQGGLVAAQTGLSLEETTAALSAFADNALVGSDAGTSLKTMLQRLTPQSAEAQQKMDELGISAYDAQGNFVGLEKFAGQLQDGLSGLTDEQKNAALATIFGSDAVRAAAILYDQGADGIHDYIGALEDQGAAARMAATQMDNLSGDLEQLRGSVETVLIRSGSGANHVLREMTQVATGAVNAFGRLPQPVQEGATALGLLAGAATLTGGVIIAGVGQISKFKTALDNLGVSSATSAKYVGMVGRAAKGLGIVGVVVGGLLALDGVLDSLTKHAKLGALGEDLIKFATDGVQAGQMARLFGDDFTDLADKIARSKRSLLTASLFKGHFTGPSQGEIRQARQDVDDLDSALSSLVQNGAPDVAAAVYQKMAAAAGRAGISAKELAEAFPGYQEALAGARGQADLAAHSTGSLTKALDKQTAAAQASAKAIRDQASALRASFDPLLAAQDAYVKQAEAQKDLNKAIKEHGRRSKEAAAAQADLLKATVDLDGAVASLSAGLKDGSVSLDDVKGRLDAYAKAGLITTKQAAAFKAQLGDVADESDKLSGKLDTLGNKKPKPKVDPASVDAANHRVELIEGRLDVLNGKHAYPSVTVRGIDKAQSEVERLITLLTHIPSPTAKVTVKSLITGGLPVDGGATGGYITAPGGPTSDSGMLRVSNGEYLVNAEATRQHRALLDLLNGGGRFAPAQALTSNTQTIDRRISYGDINIINPTREPASNLTSTMAMVAFLHEQ